MHLAISPGPDASEVLVLLRHLPGDLVELHLVVGLPHAGDAGDDPPDHSLSPQHNTLSLLRLSSRPHYTGQQSRPGWVRALLIQTGISRIWFGLCAPV